MRKAKGISIIAITLLILQILTINIGVGAVFGAVDENTKSSIQVKHLNTKGKTVTWQIDVNVKSEQEVDAKVLIAFDERQSHGTINPNKSVDITKTDTGYELNLPNRGGLYQFELQTEITDMVQTQYELQAVLEIDGIKVDDSDRIELNVEEESNEEKVDASKKTVNEENTSETMDKGKSLDDVIDKLSKKPIDQFTEAEIRKLVEGLSEDEIKQVSKALGLEEVMGVVDPNFKPFAINKSMRGFSTMSTPSWPAAGSVNLNGKTATPTGNYGEWEIKLSVEAKDVDTTKTTDIVLVFDKSGSMQGSRLTKAKAAARQFVNELLTEGSQTRIAIVTFSDSYQTLAGGFRGVDGKQNLLTAINGISASGGTNIQGGLRTANNLLANQSNAQNKVIVLLSDGAPTYSYKANGATNHTWPEGNYNFRLTNFTETQLGSGSSYNLSAPTCILGFCWGGQQYSVNGYDVKTNGIGTISEAWQIMNNGINMYSIGLDVGNDTIAMNVLRNSQNKGGYFGTGDDLNPIFEEIAGSLKYAATNAVVTDPLGDMFNLVKDKYGSGAHFTASHGTVTWNDVTETFTWNIGTIKEGEQPTLKYTVTIDWEHPDLKGHVNYPMNEETPLNYTDVDGNSAVKYFSIPEDQIGKGKIKRIGYRVNPLGEPIDADGNVVSIEQAQKFYNEYYGDFHDFESHDVPAKDVADYTVIGDNPKSITIGPNNPVETVYFGYVKTSDMVAGDVTAEYKDEAGNTISETETLTGTIGAPYTTEQKVIQGYEFVRTEGANPSGTFTANPQTVTYIYKKMLGSITINKVNQSGEALQGAEFTLTGPGGYKEKKTSDADGKITFGDLEWGTYTLKEVKAPANYRLLNKTFEIEINAENLEAELTIENTGQGWEIPKTGGIGTLGFFGAGFMLMAGAGWLLFRRRHV